MEMARRRNPTRAVTRDIVFVAFLQVPVTRIFHLELKVVKVVGYFPRLPKETSPDVIG